PIRHLAHHPLSFVSLSFPRPPPSPLFPYTTLFRSPHQSVAAQRFTNPSTPDPADGCVGRVFRDRIRAADPAKGLSGHRDLGCERSEEHTSELQSPDHLVCRLLLEKKKQ